MHTQPRTIFLNGILLFMGLQILTSLVEFTMAESTCQPSTHLNHQPSCFLQKVGASKSTRRYASVSRTIIQSIGNQAGICEPLSQLWLLSCRQKAKVVRSHPSALLKLFRPRCHRVTGLSSRREEENGFSIPPFQVSKMW